MEIYYFSLWLIGKIIDVPGAGHEKLVVDNRRE